MISDGKLIYSKRDSGEFNNLGVPIFFFSSVNLIGKNGAKSRFIVNIYLILGRDAPSFLSHLIHGIRAIPCVGYCSATFRKSKCYIVTIVSVFVPSILFRIRVGHFCFFRTFPAQMSTSKMSCECS